MGAPRPVAEVSLDSVVLVRRFSVEQGLRSDGSVKVRPIDDGTAAGVNPVTSLPQGITHHTIDHLWECCRLFKSKVGRRPALFKIDVDAAYRRVPIAPAHRPLCTVVFLHNGVQTVAEHCACCFGFTSSVDSWDRIGALLRALAAHFLYLAFLRYVDDGFGCAFESSIETCAGQVARFIRCLLGPSAIADAKIGWGCNLVVLGLALQVGESGLTARPSTDKVRKWRAALQRALDSNRLTAGQASKLAGRLMWASTAMFRKLGRAMLRPLYAHQHRHTSQLGPSLRLCLSFWEETLRLELSQERLWQEPERKRAVLLADARGWPAHLGAVLLARSPPPRRPWLLGLAPRAGRRPHPLDVNGGAS